MAKTNLLRPLTNISGDFYMFSQYAEDLTKENSQKSLYKVIPSRFAALELDATTLQGLIEERGEQEENGNAMICKYLQNSYENSCAFLRSIIADNTHIWNNFMASRLLWQNLLMYQFIHLEHIENEGSDTIICPEIKYIGDINIYTNKQIDSINYNEIYCYVPTEATERSYIMIATDEEGHAYDTSESYPYDYSTLLGWTSDNYPSNLISAGVPNSPLFGYTDDTEAPQERTSGYTIMDGNWVYPKALSPVLPANSTLNDGSSDSFPTDNTESFNINAVLVFYDVYQGEEVIYKNLPLGMYFTGTFNNDSESPAFNNTVKKFINNGDIYGQGTSYGFRILTKYVCTPSSLYYIESVVEAEDLYPEYYSVMDKMAETIDEMNEVVNSNRSFHQDIKDHLAYFKNYRTNVPYIRNVNGVPYWFVNGRNTGQKAVVDDTGLRELYNSILTEISGLKHSAVEFG